MPDKKTLERVAKDRRQGKSASTQAGEFIREEIHHIRAGKHGARSTQQAIAIGLSKARRAGVKLPLPKPGSVSATTLKNARQASAAGARAKHPVSRTRSRAITVALKHEGHVAASTKALSKQATRAARRRSAGERSAAAARAARTKGPEARSAAARKAARTRARLKTQAR